MCYINLTFFTKSNVCLFILTLIILPRNSNFDVLWFFRLFANCLSYFYSPNSMFHLFTILTVSPFLLLQRQKVQNGLPASASILYEIQCLFICTHSVQFTNLKWLGLLIRLILWCRKGFHTTIYKFAGRWNLCINLWNKNCSF